MCFTDWYIDRRWSGSGEGYTSQGWKVGSHTIYTTGVGKQCGEEQVFFTQCFRYLYGQTVNQGCSSCILVFTGIRQASFFKDWYPVCCPVAPFVMIYTDQVGIKHVSLSVKKNHWLYFVDDDWMQNFFSNGHNFECRLPLQSLLTVMKLCKLDKLLW